VNGIVGIDHAEVVKRIGVGKGGTVDRNALFLGRRGRRGRGNTTPQNI